ncbi:MAG: hypothetical protein ABI833_08645 [Acidobacteriota bacterium]
MRPLLTLAFAAVFSMGATDAAFQRATEKLDRIESGHVRPGSVIVFTPDEMNAWARGRVPQMYQGIRDPSVQLGQGSATGSAFVDFLKMRQGEGLDTNFLIAKLIQGERPLKVSIELESSHGRATARLTRLEITGVAVTGMVLDFLVNEFFLHLFPDAKVNQPFELHNNIERIELRPDGVRVTMRK